MKLVFITLFPKECEYFFLKGILGRAAQEGVFSAAFVDLRQFGVGRLKKVDDYPFSKKFGMLLRADVVGAAIKSIEGFEDYRLIYPCPKGPTFEFNRSRNLTSAKGIIFLPGYYEGVDERIFELFNVERVSLGNFVLSSSDSAALVIAEAVVRQLKGVVGNQESVAQDTFFAKFLEHPQYTQPRKVEGLEVPDILLSGHHGNISSWQYKQSISETLFNSPDLLARESGDFRVKNLLTEIIQEAIK